MIKKHGFENNMVYTNSEEYCEKVLCNLLNGNIPTYIWLLLIKKEIVMKTSLFKKEICLMEDTIFYNELFSVASQIYFLDMPTYHYFDNQTSCTRSKEYYVRNMTNLTRVYDYLIEVIDNDSYPKEKRKEILATHLSNTIAGYVFAIYMNNVERKEIIGLLKQIFKAEKNINILKNANLKLLAKHLAIPIELLRRKKYVILFSFFDLRKFLKNIKKR